MVFQEDRRDGVGRHALLDRGRELDRARVEAQQGLEHGGADHAALVDGSQDGELVVVRLAEAAAVVQVEREGQVAKDLKVEKNISEAVYLVDLSRVDMSRMGISVTGNLESPAFWKMPDNFRHSLEYLVSQAFSTMPI